MIAGRFAPNLKSNTQVDEVILKPIVNAAYRMSQLQLVAMTSDQHP